MHLMIRQPPALAVARKQPENAGDGDALVEEPREPASTDREKCLQPGTA